MYRSEQSIKIPDGRPKEGADRKDLSALIRNIGQTPLIRLRKTTEDLPDQVSVFVKAEHLNPGGSVKDRAALHMIQKGWQSGALREDKTLIDATSGNTGIAYAMLGAAFGIPVTLAMPANASHERKQILGLYGASLVLTDPMESTDGAQRYVREAVVENPHLYFYPDQYNNDANWKAHFKGTGAEIIEDTAGKVTHFVAGLGTSGTCMGVTRRLKLFDASIRCIAVQPDSPFHGIEGLKHMKTAIVPGIFDQALIDDTMFCTTEEAYDMTRRLAREEGLLVGVSAGANVSAAIKLAHTLEEGMVVTVLCDNGTRYLSETFWSDENDD